MDGVPFDIETPAELAHSPPPYEINGGGFRFAEQELLFFKDCSACFLSSNRGECGTKRQPKSQQNGTSRDEQMNNVVENLSLYRAVVLHQQIPLVEQF